MHVRYLRIQGRVLPDEVFEDYIRLFPDRPFLPRVQSINMRASSVQSISSLQWLRFLLRSSTPAENQPSASASTLKHLHICYNPPRNAGGGSRFPTPDLIAFQHANAKLGGGLEVFKIVDYHPFRRHHTLEYQGIIENAFVLPLPETVDSPAHGLRHFEVAHSLCELPDFFVRVTKMRALEHLKIWVSECDDDVCEVENKKQSVQHSLTSLEIEGFWWDLSPAINLFASPSATAQLRSLRLYYHQMDRALTGANVAQVLDFPTSVVPPEHLETLTVELVDHSLHPRSKAPILTTNVLQPLLQYRKMAKLHLVLPCSICLDLKFLHALAAVMGGTLSHLVVLRAATYWRDGSFKPVLTVEDLSTIAGVLFPRLVTLGLEVPWRDTPSCAERNYLVASSLLQTLHVGMNRAFFRQESSNVAIFLKDRFPVLQYLYSNRVENPNDDGWRVVMAANGYGGGCYGPSGEDYLRY